MCIRDRYYTEPTDQEKKELSFRDMLPAALAAMMESAAELSLDVYKRQIIPWAIEDSKKIGNKIAHMSIANSSNAVVNNRNYLYNLDETQESSIKLENL